MLEINPHICSQLFADKKKNQKYTDQMTVFSINDGEKWYLQAEEQK